MSDAPPSNGGAAALEALRRAIEAQPHGSIFLAGPACPARRRLLEALPARLGDDLESIWLEGGDLSPAAIWVRIATALGVTPGYDARRRVLQLLEDRVLRRGGLVVLAPEAETMAADSLSSLVNNARTERGLHLVLAATSAGALAARLPEDATVIDWNGEPLGVLPPSPPSRAVGETVGETAGERIETHAATRTPSPSRPASRKGRRSAAFRGAALLLAFGLAFVFAWGLSRSRSREPAESELSATGVPSPAPEPERAHPAPAPIPVATSSEAASAPEAEAPPAAAAAEPAPQPAEPSADAAQRDVPAEITAVPPPEPEAAPSPESAAPPEPTPASPPEPAAAPPPRSVAPAAEPPPPSVAVAPAPPAPPAPPPLARGVLRVDSELPVRIEIDGKPYGRTPLAGVRLPRGRHRIVARYPDGASALKSVTLGDEDVAVFYR